MIIGAGKMGEACVRHLSKKGARSVLVSNRSSDRAEALAAEFGGQAIRFDDCLMRWRRRTSSSVRLAARIRFYTATKSRK